MNAKNKFTHSVSTRGALIVSCQPVPNSPLDKPEIVAAMALAAQQAGASAIRIEGVQNLRATRPCIDVPIIGLIKRDLTDSPVRITPYLEDIDTLANEGADVIAIDGTDRLRPVERQALIERIHHHNLLTMADCSTIEDGLFCHQLGCEIIGTTMSGYTGEITPKDPDLELVSQLSERGCYVVAEGRYNTPELAAKAIQRGAKAVTVGSAITRLEHICEWYIEALKQVTH